jgi:hypothetical protein
MTLSDILERIWREPNRQMTWGRIPAAQVIGQRAPAPFAPNDDYVIIRLASMFLRDSRTLWLKLSPLAHATVKLNGLQAPRSDTAVVGPAQFGDLAAASADRSVILGQRLAGPAVWRGGDLDIAVGLFAVPKDKAAAALLDTLGQLAALGIPGLAQAGDISKIVKAGVEGLIGLDGTKPVLGAKVSLADPRGGAPAGSEAAPCLLVGVAAPAGEVAVEQLWVKDGRLMAGPAADSLRPFEAHDHVLIAVERGPPREDWRGLPALTPHQDAFDAPLRDATLDEAATKQRLNTAFAAFDTDLSAEHELTGPDQERIRGQVIAELKARVKRKFGGLFAETRSVGGISRTVSPDGFDFLDVGEGGLEAVRPTAEGTRPF